MKTRVGLILAACLATAAGAQVTHTATIWIEGPDEVVANSTFTLDVWGRFDSPDFIDGVSAIAGFGLDVICTEGRDQIDSVDGPASQGGITLESGFPVGPDLLDVRGGQMANVFGLNPGIVLDHPMRLFSFEVTVGEFTHIAFGPMNPGPDGALCFYPNSTSGTMICAPGDTGTTVVFVGWEAFVPGPSSMAVGVVALLGVGRRRRA